jgi:hypothetical protein
VDDADFALVSAYTWWLDSRGYAITSVTVGKRLVMGNKYQRRVYMHRLILSAPTGMQVDHIDHVPLNNTRANLRLATRSQNQANRQPKPGSSGVKGVTFHKKMGRWQAAIKCQGKDHYLGVFPTKEEAGAAYAAAAKRLFGEYAYAGGAA